MFRRILRTALVIEIVMAAPTLAQTRVVSDPCARIAGMQVYSNVFVHEETGDVLGYDLAFKRRGRSGADALLYVYEGGAAGAGIPLSGQISNNRLNLAGTWTEQLTEYPSKKMIVQKHPVDIRGTLKSAAFFGELKIGRMGENERVRLRRVKTIWSCR